MFPRGSEAITSWNRSGKFRSGGSSRAGEGLDRLPRKPLPKSPFAGQGPQGGRIEGNDLDRSDPPLALEMIDRREDLVVGGHAPAADHDVALVLRWRVHGNSSSIASSTTLTPSRRASSSITSRGGTFTEAPP